MGCVMMICNVTYMTYDRWVSISFFSRDATVRFRTQSLNMRTGPKVQTFKRSSSVQGSVDG